MFHPEDAVPVAWLPGAHGFRLDDGAPWTARADVRFRRMHAGEAARRCVAGSFGIWRPSPRALAIGGAAMALALMLGSGVLLVQDDPPSGTGDGTTVASLAVGPVISPGLVPVPRPATGLAGDTGTMPADQAQDTEGGVEPTPEPVTLAALVPEVEERVVAIDSGDTLIDLLLGQGLARQDAHEAIRALARVYDPRLLRVGQELKLTFAAFSQDEQDRHLADLALDADVDRSVHITRSGDGTYFSHERRIPLTQEQVRAGGAINDSLYLTATRSGVTAQMTTQLIRALSYDVDFQRDIQPGDGLDLLFDRYVDADGKALRDGDVLYAQLRLRDRTLSVYRFTPKGQSEAEYFDGNGRSLRKALLRTPIDGARLSSGFGMRRHPVLGYTKFHRGLDFAAPTGTPIYAAGDGRVAKAGRFGSYGNYVRLEHDGGYATAYAHMSRIKAKPGQRVRQGQVIGYVGTTGRSTGPHLHYELMVNGTQINPAKKTMPIARALAGDDLRRFKERKRAVEQALARAPQVTAMVPQAR